MKQRKEETEKPISWGQLILFSVMGLLFTSIGAYHISTGEPIYSRGFEISPYVHLIAGTTLLALSILPIFLRKK